MLRFIKPLDEAILFFLQEHLRNPFFDGLMVFITKLGNAGFIWLLAAFILMLTKRYQKCGLILFSTHAISKFIGDDLLKPLFHRMRPCNKFPEIHTIISAPHSPSFPSGHTMISFACAMILFHYNHKLGVCGFVIAALIAFSRMYLFVHYPSDILGGIIFGLLTSKIVLTLTSHDN